MASTLLVIGSKNCETRQLANLLQHGGRVDVIIAPDISDATARSKNCVKFAEVVTQALDLAQVLVFVLGFKYGVRRTEDDRAMERFVENVLGYRLLADHTFIVFQSFDRAPGGGEVEPMTDLCQSCQGRMFALHSADRTELEIVQQVDNFLQAVEQHVISEQYRPYSREEFQQAHQTRKIEMVSSRQGAIERETRVECKRINSELNCAQKHLEPEHQQIRLQELVRRAERLHEKVSSVDQGTGILKHLEEMVNFTRQSVTTALNVCSNQAFSDGRIQHLEDTMSRNHASSDGRMQSVEDTVDILHRRQQRLCLIIFILLTMIIILVLERLNSIDVCTWSVMLAWLPVLFFCWWNKMSYKICSAVLVSTVSLWYLICRGTEVQIPLLAIK